MHREKTFWQRYYDTIFLFLTILPGLVIVGLTGIYPKAIYDCSVNAVSVSVFIIVLLSCISIFNAFNFNKKKSLLSFILMSIIALVMVIPAVHIASNIQYIVDANGTIDIGLPNGNLAIVKWTQDKVITVVGIILPIIVLLIGILMAAFRIDLRVRHKDEE